MTTDSSTPEAAAGCPFHTVPMHKFPLPRIHPMDPPQQYREAEVQCPIHKVEQWNGKQAWFFTRYDDIRSLLTNPRTSADASHPNYPAQNAALAIVRKDYQVFAQMDPPEHTSERRLVAGDFSVQRIELMRPKIQALVDRRIEAILSKPKKADLIADFAGPVPCGVICTLLGVPETDHSLIQSWAREISSLNTSSETAAVMIKDFCDNYLTNLVRKKNAAPEDDLLSRLIVQQMRTGHISELKVVSLARLFLTAGHESSSDTLGLGLAALLYNQDQLALLRDNPALIKGAVEEILRYTDVTHSGRLRTAREDIEIGGVTVRKDDAIIMHQPTANRDPALFPNPNQFDICRPPRPHLTFGTGIHSCIGQPLARMELQIAIGSLIQRIPTLRPTQALEALHFHHRLAIYGLESLPVTW